ncbi:MAG: SUF system Fe-S cluster assembly regulator [Pseudomonadota bacterium]
MLRISKLTDYGTVVLASLVNSRHKVISAAEIAGQTGISLPTVSKLLKTLAREGLVESARGANGGYRLSRDPERISAADIIEALEGPISITECLSSDSHCDYQQQCSPCSAWRSVNNAIRVALSEVTLIDLANDASRPQVMQFGGMLITVERTV